MAGRALDYSYLAPQFPLAIAHRGGAGDWPENSLMAFQGAYELGFRYMETDVHLTSDGQVVAFHDVTLDRLEGSAVSIRDLPWQQIQRLKLAQDSRVPLMAELFEALPDARFNIDMKCDEVVDPMIDLVVTHQAQERVCLASFSDKRIRRVRERLGNAVCVSAGRAAVTLQVLRSRGLPGRPSYPPVLQVPIKRYGLPVLTRALVERCHRDGKHVHVWTINDAKEMSRLLDLGVDGIVTDYPSRLRQVMRDKGLWED